MGAGGGIKPMIEGTHPVFHAERIKEQKEREERIATLETQLKDATSRYDKLFINRTGGQTTQYQVAKQGKRVGDVKTIPTPKRSSGSYGTGTNLKIQGTGTNLG